MKTTIALLVTVLVPVLTTPAVKAAEPISAKAALESLKKLAGDWEGTAGNDDKGSPANVTYKVTGHGTTVMEVLFPGTPHEMVSMYHLDGEKLVMTHYCAMGNQPKMALDKKSSAHELRFNFAGGSNFDPKKDTHMHAGAMKFVDGDTLEAVWEVYGEGRKAGENRFKLKRKK